MISAVVPVRDGEPFLVEAIASLRAQTRPPDEIVVVDDGSAEPVALDGVRVLSRPPLGASAARNAGAEAARGDLLAFLDADDLAAPDRLERQLAALGDADAVFGSVRTFLERPDLPYEVPPVQATPHVGTMLIRRAVFLASGGFDPAFEPAEFIEWHDRVRPRAVMLDAVLMERRIHGDNWTLRVDRSLYARTARAAILRRR